MIIFDYGQTLADESPFDGIKGTEALLKYAVENKYNASAAEIQEEASRLNKELGRFDPKSRHLMQIEVPNFMFNAYLYESMGVKLSVSGDEADKIFWDAAAPAKPADGIEKLLDYLHKSSVRTGVISNISYSGNAVKDRINSLLPENHFEFIIATSEYMFRKPNRRIFDLALKKSGLSAEDVYLM